MAPADESPFLAPVLARYADDGPRLIYADFLAESDDPADRARAELIAVQVGLARLGDDHPRRQELLDRQADLLQRHLADWSAPLRGLAVGFEFRRGLLDAVSADARTFLARGDELFRRAAVRRVRLLDAGGVIDRLPFCPHLAHVRELDLCGNDLGNGGLNVLLRSPYLGRVEELDLSFNGLCDGGVRLLARSAALPRLSALLLTDNGQISGDGVAALAMSPRTAGLRVLDVSGNDVGDAGARAVADPRHLPRLHTFRVHNNHIGDAGVAALVGSPLLARMLARSPRLDLRQNAVGPAGAAALAAAPALGAAAALDLSGNYLGDAGVTAVAFSPHLTRLRRLRVRQNGITDDGAVTLAHSPLMPRLAHLDVSANRLTDKGVDLLFGRRKSWRTVLEAADNFASDRPTVNGQPRPDDRPALLDREVSRILRRYLPAGARAGPAAG